MTSRIHVYLAGLARIYYGPDIAREQFNHPRGKYFVCQSLYETRVCINRYMLCTRNCRRVRAVIKHETALSHYAGV